jgi:quercetin dioxygenase-like cupin family protein
MTSPMVTLLRQAPPFLPGDVEVVVVEVDLPPGDPGSPPHRHSGPVFGYVVEGELLYQLDDHDERVITAGQAFWEPGGDVIHYKAANNAPVDRTRFVAVIIGRRGEPPMTFPTPAELATHQRQRQRRRGDAANRGSQGGDQ